MRKKFKKSSSTICLSSFENYVLSARHPQFKIFLKKYVNFFCVGLILRVQYSQVCSQQKLITSYTASSPHIMQEDSLLSSLSNVSYHGKDQSFNGADFFDRSLPAGEVGAKKKDHQNELEVSINDLGFNSGMGPGSPHNHFLGALHWTGGNEMGEGESQIGSNYPMDHHVSSFHLEDNKEKRQAPSPKLEVKAEQTFGKQPEKKKVILIKTEAQQFLNNIKIEADVSPTPKKKKTAKQAPAISDKRVKKEESSEYSQSQKERRPTNRGLGSAMKNETKNIPKNYGKAIITYIEKYRAEFEEILREEGVTYQEFMEQLSLKKKSINTIANLRELWIDFKYSKSMRALSNQFLRKHALHYIFNSRICNYSSHIKYRKRLQEAIENPTTFRHIKEY